MRDYSQSGEQAVILEAVGPGPHRDARFIDIGCWDPITFSNTRALYELGWTGVMIEPSPGPFIELLRCCTNAACCVRGTDERIHETYGNRKQRECSICGSPRYGFDPNLTLILGAVESQRGLVKIDVTDDALSTHDADSRAKWDKVGGFYGSMLINAITIPDILNQFGSFDFWNIDVEGHSAELFLECLRLDQRPVCFCVEVDGGRLNEMMTAASAVGYRGKVVGANLVVWR